MRSMDQRGVGSLAGVDPSLPSAILLSAIAFRFKSQRRKVASNPPENTMPSTAASVATDPTWPLSCPDT